MSIVETSRPPEGGILKSASAPSLLLTEEHHLCPGCGHPLAVRVILETVQELALERRTVGVFGHGCSGTFNTAIDVDVTIALHGRAPACATGIKRMRPDVVVWTMQGDGDMVSEGLAEIIHAAARGEKLTCFLLNNGVFGDTGGQMTAATAVGQRSKTSVEGRDAVSQGYPVPLAEMLALLPSVSFIGRASVHDAAGVVLARRMVRKGFEHQIEGRGFALVEIYTMCPTGWVTPTAEGPDYMSTTLGKGHRLGILKEE